MYQYKKETKKEKMSRKAGLVAFKKKLADRKKKEEIKRIPYSSQLKDKRWFAFREKVFKKRGRVCEMCGCRYGLQIHHKKYKPLHFAWEYKTNEVVVLCRSCHKEVHGIK